MTRERFNPYSTPGYKLALILTLLRGISWL